MKTSRNVMCLVVAVTALVAATSYAAEPAPAPAVAPAQIAPPAFGGKGAPKGVLRYTRPTLSLAYGLGPQYGWVGGVATAHVPFVTGSYATGTLEPHVGIGTEGGKTDIFAKGVGLSVISHFSCGVWAGVDATYGAMGLVDTMGQDVGPRVRYFVPGTTVQAVTGYTWSTGIRIQFGLGRSTCANSNDCDPILNGSAGLGFVF